MTLLGTPKGQAGDRYKPCLTDSVDATLATPTGETLIYGFCQRDLKKLRARAEALLNDPGTPPAPLISRLLEGYAYSVSAEQEGGWRVICSAQIAGYALRRAEAQAENRNGWSVDAIERLVQTCSENETSQVILVAARDVAGHASEFFSAGPPVWDELCRWAVEWAIEPWEVVVETDGTIGEGRLGVDEADCSKAVEFGYALSLIEEALREANAGVLLANEDGAPPPIR